jgi:hypothetical protein
MDLLERYLAAVARDLPERQRADVVAELRDSLLSMIEDAEARLGRPQTRAELEAMLVGFGHPLVVAGRYRQVQHLIGPEVFPFWWAGLRASLAIVAAVYLVLVGIETFTSGDASRVLRGIDASLIGVLVFTFGAVTLVGAAVERWGKPRLLTRWKPRELPPAKDKPASPFERSLELAMSLIFFGWWTGAIEFRNWIGQDVQLELAPVWALWWWPILAYSVFECVCRLVALVRPGAARLVLGLNTVRNLAAAAILGGVIQAGHFVEAAGLPDRVQEGIDKGMAIGFAIAIVGCLGGALRDGWRLWRVEAPAFGLKA